MSQAQSELVSTVQRVRSEWEATLSAQETEAREAYAKAVEDLSRTRQRFDYVRAVQRWMQTFPSPKIFKVGLPSVRFLEGPGRDGIAWTLIVDALRKEAAPPVEEPWPQAKIRGERVV